MTNLEKEVNDIIENSDFENLPYEEGKRINKYMQEQKIFTVYQTLLAFPELTNEAWKKKQREWLETLVRLYRKEYTDYE